MTLPKVPRRACAYPTAKSLHGSAKNLPCFALLEHWPSGYLNENEQCCNKMFSPEKESLIALDDPRKNSADTVDTEPGILKILVIVSDFPKVTETFVLRNVQHYVQQGHDVDIFHIKPYRKDEVVHGAFADIAQRGFGIPWMSGAAIVQGMRRPFAVAGIKLKIFRAFLRKPRHLVISLALISKALALSVRCRRDGIGHIHAEFAGYPATVAWITSKMTGIPFSFSAHAHDIFITQGLLVEKAQDAAFVRAISDFNKRFLEALPGFPANKVEVLRCGVAVPDTVPPAPPPVPVRLVFVGALLPRKGVDVLLRAAATLPDDLDWHLDILGGGSQEGVLRGLADTLPKDRVTFHGPQPSDKVLAAMQSAHVVVVPSREGEEGRSEGIPVVLMEAMSLARPVIASRLSGIPELVIDGETGLLVPPDDPEALGRALRDILSNPGRATELAQAGRTRVAKSFDIDKTAAQLLQRMIEEST